MCGIFGYVKNSSVEDNFAPTLILKELGILSMERGKDSSGVAFVDRDTPANEKAYLPGRMGQKVVNAEKGISIYRDVVQFDRFWDDETHGYASTQSLIAIGHTRWKTQGAATIHNSSPMPVGNIIATHNGDIDKSSVPTGDGRGDVIGNTDSEHLFRAISSLKSHRKNISLLLSEVVGRVAMAWFDRRTPDRLMLARGALSPLAVAYDQAGNLYWASNPNWFRIIEDSSGGFIHFSSIRVVREGSLLTVSVGDATPMVTDIRQFTPTSRHSDERLLTTAVWRNWDSKDTKIDQEGFIRNVLPAPKPSVSRFKETSWDYPSLTPKFKSYNDRWESEEPLWGDGDEWDGFSEAEKMPWYPKLEKVVRSQMLNTETLQEFLMSVDFYDTEHMSSLVDFLEEIFSLDQTRRHLVISALIESDPSLYKSLSDAHNVSVTVIADAVEFMDYMTG